MRFFLLFVILAACSSPSPKTPQTLRISFNMQPNTLDPCKAGDFVSSTLICMIYEGLTRCLPGGDVEPGLAERYEVSRDQKVYLFHLRKAFWSDGSPITAYDFERSWKGLLRSPSVCTYLLYPIKNGEKCAKGEIPVSEVGIWALSDQTLCVELERPTPYFYSLTAFPSLLPAHAENPEAYSGPFRIEKMVRNSEIVLEKNETYWNRDAISLDEVHISIVPDEMTALQMFERGDLDWLGGALSPLPPDPLDKIKEPLAFIPSAATTLISFNTEVFPFNNVDLRKAFSYAIDRQEIVDKVTIAGQIPATSMLPPSLSSKEPLISTNAELARVHLKLAGIEATDLNDLVLYFKPSQIDKRLAQTLQRQWQEVLGVTVQLAQLDLKSHAQRLQVRDYQIALASWIAQFDDPISILERFKDKSNLKNYTGWENGDYVRLLQEASGSSKRRELLGKAEALFADQMPLTPIYHWSSPALCGPRIDSYGTTPCGGVLFERFQVAKKN
jgi:oligopeptide transport system substrate-binding protein